MKLYASRRFVNSNEFKGERYGLPWAQTELKELLKLFDQGIPLSETMKIMQRPAVGIIAKLRTAYRLIERVESYYYAEGYPKTPPGDISISVICPEPAQGGIIKETNGCITADLISAFSIINNCIKTEEIKIMDMNKNIEVVTFIRGVEASKKSDDEIFRFIKELENDIASLQAIENKPKKLEERIEGLKADIAALVAYIDGR